MHSKITINLGGPKPLQDFHDFLNDPKSCILNIAANIMCDQAGMMHGVADMITERVVELSLIHI